MADELHISSLVVHARPECVDAVRLAADDIAGCEVHAATASGKLVLTLETTSERAITETLDQLGLIEGVLAATLVYHQVETLAKGR